VALGASVVAGSVFASVIIGYQEANVQAKRLTPVIFVEEVRPCLAFWTDVLGFEVTGEVPEGEGDGLAYASVGSGTLELMYQTYAGVEEDLPAMAGRAPGDLPARAHDVLRRPRDRAASAVRNAGRTCRIRARRRRLNGPESDR
jgi:catechol 2,3-dioxygenase-like lactoylglutathione lyase family enzyme